MSLSLQKRPARETCGGFKPITRFSECKISLGFALFAEVASRLAPNFAGVFERRTIIIRELRQHPGEKKHRKRRGLAAVAADQERTRGVLHQPLADLDTTEG